MDTSDIPASPKHVFLLNSAADLCRKLHWERNRLQEALAYENYRFPDPTPAYMALNCAITAWHLADWTWQTADDDQRKALANILGFSLTVDERRNLDKFYDALGAKYPELLACRDIANGSKHFVLSKEKGDATAIHAFHRVIEASTTGLKRGDYVLDLSVEFGGERMSALRFFDRIFSLWYNLLGAVGMMEPQAVAQGKIPEAP